MCESSTARICAGMKMIRAHYPEIEHPKRYSKEEVDNADIIVDWHFGCHLPDWFGGACASLTDRYPNYRLVRSSLYGNHTLFGGN